MRRVPRQVPRLVLVVVLVQEPGLELLMSEPSQPKAVVQEGVPSALHMAEAQTWLRRSKAVVGDESF